MRGIDDVLKEGFERHSRAVDKRGGFGAKRASAAVGAIRRRRVIRGATTGGVSVLVAAALAVGAVRLAAAEVDPIAPEPNPDAGAYEWCDLTTYPVPDVAAMGPNYKGRVYANYETNVYVYAAPDGSHAVLEPEEDGSYIATAADGTKLEAYAPGDLVGVEWKAMAFDYWVWSDGRSESSGFPYLEDPDGLQLRHEWATTTPDRVPQGVSAREIAEVHATSLNSAGGGLPKEAVPEGALVETVIRWIDGRERAFGITWGSPGVRPPNLDGVASVSTRVSNLPNGEVFEITSTYDPTKTWAAACNAAPIETPSPTVAMGSYAWCDLTTYPVPNPEAYTEYYGYLGRIYANYGTMELVYVSPDGTHQLLERDADGVYAAFAPDGERLDAYTDFEGPVFYERYWVLDYWSGGSIGRPYLEALEDPGLAYEWTTVVPEDAPPGLQVGTLLKFHAMSIGFVGTVLTKSAVPDEAIVETVIRWTDGREEVVDTGVDGAGAGIRDFTGLASVSLRVSNLPGGEVFEITSTYDPTKTWAAACGPVPIESPAPTPSVDALQYGPYFEGPESAVFRCLAPLPPELENAIPATVEYTSGEVRFSDPEAYTENEAGGAMVTTVQYMWPVPGAILAPTYPGWERAWSSETGGSTFGFVSFGALGWVDQSGVLVGRAEWLEGGPNVGSVGRGGSGMFGSNGESIPIYVMIQEDAGSGGVPCDGADPATLDDATIVYIQGAGPDSENMTWSWTRIWPAE